MTGWFEYDDPIPYVALFGSPIEPLAYFFTDGVEYFDSNNSSPYRFSVSGNSDASPGIAFWMIGLRGNDGSELSTIYYGSEGEATDSAIDSTGTVQGYIQADRGSWTAVQVPEPNALLEALVFFIALSVGVVAVRRRAA